MAEQRLSFNVQILGNFNYQFADGRLFAKCTEKQLENVKYIHKSDFAR